MIQTKNLFKQNQTKSKNILLYFIIFYSPKTNLIGRVCIKYKITKVSVFMKCTIKYLRLTEGEYEES